MGKASPAIAAFNAGEFSPQMEGRVDAEKYPIAAHIQQNFIALKQGPSTFRPGTAYVQPVKSSSRAWLVRFEFSQTQAFVLEFGGGYVRFYTNHGPLLSTGNPAYGSGTAYVVGNQVVSGGITYYCLAPTTGNAPPNTTYWYPMAAYNGSATTAIYEIPAPYAAADLTDSLGEFALQLKQSGDVIYIAGGSAGTGYPPYTLTRYANNPPNWIFARYAPTDGPYLTPLPLVPGSEIALGVVASSASAATTGSTVTINSYGGNAFAATDVGRLVRIQLQTYNVTPWSYNVAWTAGTQCSNNGNNYTALANGTSGASPPVHTAGVVADGPVVGTNVNWLYTDSGYGVAQITAYTSPSSVTATVLSTFPYNTVVTTATITAITQANPAVVSAANTFFAHQAMFITGVNGMTQINNTALNSQSVTTSAITLGVVNSLNYGAYTSGGTIIGNASTEWQMGAWSNTTEWPRALDFFKDRLFWAGKLNVWGSVPGAYSSHAPDTFGQQTTASAINVLVTGADASNICWLSGAIILLIGTEGGEYGLDAANYSTSPLGPSNVEVLRQSNWRCRHIAPWLIGTTVLYVQRAGRKVFAMDYNFYLNRYDSTDQSKYAYHITIGGLNSICYQQEPWSILWATRTDGTLLSYTFNREDNVTAWTRHNVGGNGVVESITVVPSPDAARDELWMIVNRAGVRTVEYMVKHWEGPQAGYAGDAQSAAWYVDCGVQSVATPAPGATTTTITNIPAVLRNQTVAILADGGVQSQQVVSSTGTLTLQGAFTTVTMGFPYQGNLVPMRLESGADTGTAQGKKKQGSTVVVRLVDSAGGQVSQLISSQNAQGSTSIATTNAEYLHLNLSTTALNSPPAITSGDIVVSFPHNAPSSQDESDFYILVQQNDPLPMTVAALMPQYKVEEWQ